MTWLGAFSQERQWLWLSKDDLRDSSSWSSPPLLLLREIHAKLLTQYDCKEVCASSQSQVNVGVSAGLRSQDGVSQQRTKLLTQYDCKEVCALSQSQVNVGSSAGLSSEDGVSHQQRIFLFY